MTTPASFRPFYGVLRQGATNTAPRVRLYAAFRRMAKSRSWLELTGLINTRSASALTLSAITGSADATMTCVRENAGVERI